MSNKVISCIIFSLISISFLYSQRFILQDESALKEEIAWRSQNNITECQLTTFSVKPSGEPKGKGKKGPSYKYDQNGNIISYSYKVPLLGWVQVDYEYDESQKLISEKSLNVATGKIYTQSEISYSPFFSIARKGSNGDVGEEIEYLFDSLKRISNMIYKVKITPGKDFKKREQAVYSFLYNEREQLETCVITGGGRRVIFPLIIDNVFSIKGVNRVIVLSYNLEGRLIIAETFSPSGRLLGGTYLAYDKKGRLSQQTTRRLFHDSPLTPFPEWEKLAASARSPLINTPDRNAEVIEQVSIFNVKSKKYKFKYNDQGILTEILSYNDSGRPVELTKLNYH